MLHRPIKIEAFVYRHRILLTVGVWLFFLGNFLVRQLPAASKNSLLGDEAGIVFVWNHPFPTAGFFAATRSPLMPPPLDNFAGSVWWRVLNAVAPEWCRNNMELAVRTYPMLVMALGLTTLFVAAFIVSNSASIALLLAALLISHNRILAAMAVEPKFFAALFFFTTLSWLAFIIARNELAKPTPFPLPFWFWLSVNAIGVWAHFFVAVSALAQAALLAWFFYHHWQSRGNLARFTHVPILWMSAILVGDAGLVLLYRKFFANQAPAFDLSNCSSIAAAFADWSDALTRLLPYFGIYWILLAFALGVIGWLLRHTAFLMTGAYFVMVGLCVAAAFFRWFYSCKNYIWEPAHLNFIFPLAFLCLAQGLAWLLAGLHKNLLPGIQKIFLTLSLLIFVFVSPLAGKTCLPEGDSLVRLRRTLQNSQLRVKGVIGIQHDADPSMSRSEDGTRLGFAWELYLKGPHGLPSILECSDPNREIGLVIIPCSERGKFPPIDAPAVGEEVYIDFCDLKNIVIRSPKATLASNQISSPKKRLNGKPLRK